jgi:hypothetical protein
MVIKQQEPDQLFFSLLKLDFSKIKSSNIIDAPAPLKMRLSGDLFFVLDLLLFRVLWCCDQLFPMPHVSEHAVRKRLIVVPFCLLREKS